VLPRHRMVLAVVPLLVLTACADGGSSPATSAGPSAGEDQAAGTPATEPAPSQAPAPSEEGDGDVAAELVARAERLVEVRDEFLTRPTRQDPAMLDEVSVGDLRRNLGRSGETLPLVDERAYGFVGGTGVVWVEVVEVDTDPAETTVDGVEDVSGTAVVAICQDNTALEVVDEAGEVLPGAAEIPDSSVAGFRLVQLDDGPDGGGWYASSGLTEQPEVDRPCPED
jgi:hypothetical protein